MPTNKHTFLFIYIHVIIYTHTTVVINQQISVHKVSVGVKFVVG